jgi:chemotaxis protein methyltransferase CheR
MDTATFEKFRQVVYDRSGISLGPSKEALVASRVAKRMRTLGLQEYGDYLDFVLRDRAGDEMVHLVDAISTNVTSFFREPDHFTFLSAAVKEWLGTGQRRFRIWSAAASTGEEPYTLAMTLCETIQEPGVDVKILGTDISTKVLQTCKAGVYSIAKLKGVPAELRQKYFERCHEGDEECYAVKGRLAGMVTFSRLNLSTPPFPMRGPFDLVFCRNVMIYFDNEIRRRLLREVCRLLRPGGYLMVGHAESLTGMLTDLKVVRPSVYVKP